MRIKIVLVVWWDAVADTGWKDKAEAGKMLDDNSHIANSLGVILKRDKNYLYLAADFGKDSYNRLLAIPLPNIRKITTIANVR